MTDFTNMIEKNKWNFLVIKGINHLRLVGIHKELGIAVAFSAWNYEYYRNPETEEEVKACREVARAYYDECIDKVRISEFGIMEFKDLPDYVIEDFMDECVL